jgi:hypothetical protein
MQLCQKLARGLLGERGWGVGAGRGQILFPLKKNYIFTRVMTYKGYICTFSIFCFFSWWYHLFSKYSASYNN